MMAPLQEVDEASKSVETEKVDDSAKVAMTAEGYHHHTLGTVIEEYEGPIVGGLFNGQGSAVFKGGESYVGDFKDGLMHGRGEYQWLDSTVYEGEMSCGRIKGVGHYFWSDGSTYQGEVKDGFRHGKGVFHNPNINCVYDGEWKRGLRHGQGKLSYDQDDQAYYQGEWRLGKRHGAGKLQYASGNVYDGEWQLDKKCGLGVMRWLDQNQMYTGLWTDDQPSGKGTYVWDDIAGLVADMTPSGPRTTHLQVYNRYAGEFKHGVRHGHGTFFYSNGAVYNGDYDGNRKHGQGRYVFENGTTYTGEFVMDRMSEVSLWHSQDTTRLDLQIEDILELWGKTQPTEMSLHDDLQSLVEREKQKVSNILLRYYDTILEIYYHYCHYQCEELDGTVVASLRMSSKQFWQFCEDCNIFSAFLTRADVNRIVLFHILNDKDCPTRELVSDLHGVHDGNHVLLVREFAEALVRIGYCVYRPDLVEEEEEESHSLTFSELIKRFFMESVVPNARTKKRAMKSHVYRHPHVKRNVVQTILAKYAPDFKKVYDSCSKQYVDVTAGPYRMQIDDRTINMRQFALLLQERKMLTKDFPLHLCLKFIRNHPNDDLMSHLEAEMIFPEFMERIVQVGLYVKKVIAAMGEEALESSRSTTEEEEEEEEELDVSEVDEDEQEEKEKSDGGADLEEEVVGSDASPALIAKEGVGDDDDDGNGRPRSQPTIGYSNSRPLLGKDSSSSSLRRSSAILGIELSKIPSLKTINSQTGQGDWAREERLPEGCDSDIRLAEDVERIVRKFLRLH
jgi:hypothetical protein